MRSSLFGLALVVSVLPGVAAAGDELPDYNWVRDGHADVIDGQTILFEGKPMRLYGIAAPALDQICHKADGSPWACGRASRDVLALLIGTIPLKCFGLKTPPDYDGAEMVTCWNARANLNIEMVIRGAALANRQQTNRYLREERYAARLRLGLWSGTFEPPWQYRAAKGGT